MKEALWALDKPNWLEYFKPWAEATNLTEEALSLGVKTFVDAQTMFTGDPTIKSAADALDKSGFNRQPAIVRILLYCRIGEVMTGGFFYALRDVTMEGCAPANICDIAGMVGEGRLVAERLAGKKPSKTPYDEQRSEYLAALHQIDELYRTVDSQASALCMRDHVIKELQGSRYNLLKDIGATERQSLWQHLKTWWRSQT